MTEPAHPLHGKVCIVTGATAGIGFVTARELARMGASVVLVGRNEPKCIATVAQIRQQTGNTATEYLVADLAAQQAVRHLASAFQQRHNRLDVLVNNAGAFYNARQESADGIELTFALNHLSYFLLTNLLLDSLKASGDARIVSVSSDAHRGASIDFADIQGQRRYSGWRAYAQSKLANVLFTYELARRLAGSGITANALHPGVVATNFATNNGLWGRLLRGAMDLVAVSAEQGAQTSIYLASSPAVAGVRGQYFEQCRAVRSARVSYDNEVAQRLWALSAELTGLPV